MDWLIAGAAAGMASTFILRVAGELLLYFTGIFPDFPYYEYVTILMLPPQPMPLFVSVMTFVFSISASSIVFGAVQAYTYLRTGTDYLLFKGAGWGVVLAAFHISLIPKLWEPLVLVEQVEPWVIPWEIIVHIAWGLLTGVLFVRFAGKIQVGPPSAEI